LVGGVRQQYRTLIVRAEYSEMRCRLGGVLEFSAVPTGLGSIFGGFTQGLRPGLSRAAPSGLRFYRAVCLSIFGNAEIDFLRVVISVTLFPQ
jgi:hypothetical protein